MFTPVRLAEHCLEEHIGLLVMLFFSSANAPCTIDDDTRRVLQYLQEFATLGYVIHAFPTSGQVHTYANKLQVQAAKSYPLMDSPGPSNTSQPWA